MPKHIHTFIRDLSEDSAILKLLKEIEFAVQFPMADYLKNSMVIHYLTDYRVRRPITRESLDAIPFSDDLLLRQKIKSLHDTDIYWLCNEIAQMKLTGVEKHEGSTLYVFLDRFLKDSKKKISKSPLPGYMIP
jgi:hypothetical protein